MSTLDHLWAGWRSAYIEGVASQSANDGECLFCRLQRLDDDEGLVLERTARTFTVMNAYPYTSGHLMVAPLRHVPDLESLDPDEAAAVMHAVQRACVALRAAFRPDGLNVGVNVGRVAGAGIPGHVHVHGLPRWSGDTNFMTSVADTRVLPETLRASWAKLRAAWPET
ncbi:MAG TPA: HIT domain-containing protein [Acidimicrobiia bacterium]|nr:HIT domain-containing protein [Acidimicrobiia bacterium]